ncbi:MAG TPA: diaminopimelate decarboxylase [Burkholderiaceae bacterium]|nr:diaminopimelate decarboxylase [Burkholderiaceae bacterium]
MTPTLPDSDGFGYRDGQLHCEALPLATIADRFGTPLYVYSRRAIERAFDRYADALGGRPALVCYAMKANSNLAVLDLLARRGAGFDIVSGGELERVLAAGGDPRRTVFSGVGKTEQEIERALAADILCFNIESTPELERIDSIARRLGKRARISVRVNPDVDAGTHPYISTGLKENKFGVAYAETLPLYLDAARRPAIEIAGIDCHIGSQITEIAPYVDAADRVLDLVDALEREGIDLHHIDFGGGLGIRYDGEAPPATGDLVRSLLQHVDARGHGAKTVMFEPGRSIVGNAGVLLTHVEYLKHGESRNFAIVDAAMNDLIRPTMYDAWMGVVPVVPHSGACSLYDVVGPVCESGDWLARDRSLALQAGDLLAVTSAGAYGMAMSSNYNTRPRAAEVMVDGGRAFLVRERERAAQLFAAESRLP